MTALASGPPPVSIENTDGAGGVPKRDRVSARKLTEYIRQHYESGLSKRKPHARGWIMVRSIMREIHHFSMAGGVYRALPPDPRKRKSRAVAQIMKPKYVKELGRYNANEIGVTVTPRVGEGAKRFYMATRGQAIMDQWADDVDLQGIFDEQNQQLLYYGMCGLHAYPDKLYRMARVTPVPGPQIFPIPYDACRPEDCDGLIRVQIVTRQWLELQDEILESQLGSKEFPHMAREAGQHFRNSGDSIVGLTSLDDPTGSLEGAVMLNVWLKPTEQNPSGQWGLIINERMYRYVSGFDEQGNSLALLGGNKNQGTLGRIPLEIIYDVKVPDDFWGYGFCDALIALQRERNRQLSNLVQHAHDNKSFFGYDAKSFDPKKIGDGDSMFIPINTITLDNTGAPRSPLFHYPAQQASRDVGAVLQIVSGMADEVVNHESPVISGIQSGRTEGGPATDRLNANANAPLVSVFNRMWRKWKIVFADCLDINKALWPAEKVIRTAGRLNLAREMRVKQEDVPWSWEIILTPNPMVPGGKEAMAQLLFALKSMPADDGQGFELKSHEFRAALRKIGYAIPGLELHSREQERISDRIEWLMGDGQVPQVRDMGRQWPEMPLENHRLAIELLKDKMLDVSFRFLGPAVQQAMFDQIQFHRSMLDPQNPPDQFDDDIDRAEGLMQETILNAGENDLSGFEGQVALDGMPLGL